MVGRVNSGQSAKGSTVDEVAAGVTIFLPLSLALLGSRVLSKVPVGPIYLYDVSLLVAAVGLLFLLARHGLRSVSATPVVLLTLAILPAWGTVLFLMSDFSRDALREYHPFLTFLYALFVVLASRYASPRVWRWGTRGLVLALIGHWVFLSIRMLNKRYDWWRPESELARDLLAITGDADGWLLGLLAALVVWRFLPAPGVSRFISMSAVIGLHVQVALLENRAAQLSAVLMLFIAILVASKTSPLRRGRKWDTAVISRGFISLALAIVLSLTVTDIGERYRGAIHYVVGVVDSDSGEEQTAEAEGQRVFSLGEPSPSPPSEEHLGATKSIEVDTAPVPYVSGEGTARARLTSWMALVSWMFAEPSRFVFGVGMGTDYFWESGARELLMGIGERQEGENRWPHNFLLTVFAVAGILGLTAFLGLLFWASTLLVRQSFLQGADSATIALLIFSGTITVSFFGVVFENPFGSIPFAWAVGIALSRGQARISGREQVGGV